VKCRRPVVRDASCRPILARTHYSGLKKVRAQAEEKGEKRQKCAPDKKCKKPTAMGESLRVGDTGSTGDTKKRSRKRSGHGGARGLDQGKPGKNVAQEKEQVRKTGRPLR